MVQHFASDYVRYEKTPSIDSSGALILKGKVNGATMEIGDVSSVVIGYDPPPRGLTRGQLAYTYSLCSPTTIGYLVKPLPPGWTYNPPLGEAKEYYPRNECVDPYETDPSREAPSSPHEAWAAWETARLTSFSEIYHVSQRRDYRMIAERLEVSATAFNIRADLSALLDEHGPGIYTIWLWGRPSHMDRPAVLSQRSIFWKTEPPEGNPYGVHREK